MDASDYDDTDLTLEDLREIARTGVLVEVTNLGGTSSARPPLVRMMETASTAVTRSETVRFVGKQDQTIRGYLEVAGT